MSNQNKDNSMSISSKIRLVNMENSNLCGFADVTIDGNITIRNVKIVEGKNGLFASMPSVKGRNDYYEPIVTMEKDYYQKFSDLVVDDYCLVKDQAMDEDIRREQAALEQAGQHEQGGDIDDAELADDLPFEQTM